MDGYAKLEKMLHKGEITVDEVLHIAWDNKLMNARSVKEVETSVDKRIASPAEGCWQLQLSTQERVQIDTEKVVGQEQ